MRYIHFFLILSFLIYTCQSPEEKQNHLGEIEFTVTAAPEAKAVFKEGLLLLHSFEYADSREAFQQAQKIDSTFAMAYWGEALTHNHNLWAQQDYEKGTEALARLDSLCDLSVLTPLERDLVDAAKVLYGEGDKVDRDQAYAQKMEELYHAYPGNHEVAAFYALSLLGSVPMGRDEEVYGKGARIAQGILAENPRHPGALHYLIHSYDDPGHAFLALDAANSYANVAPDAAHALHMPSHIYVAMGMWDEVVSSNIASYAASVKRSERKNLGHNGRSYHAFAWLLYGYLQKGNWTEANRIMEEMTLYTSESPSKSARSYLIDMTGAYLTALGSWNSTWADFDVRHDDLNIQSQALFDFIKGMQAFTQSDSEKLKDIIYAMALKREAGRLQLDERGIAMCGAFNSQLPNQFNLDQAQILEMELQAQLSQLNGDQTKAEEWLKEAVALESSISYSYGPPEVVKPSWEMYGEWLLAQGRAAEAKKQFDYALKRGPRRVLALQGLRQVLEALGREAQADSVGQVIEEIQQPEREQAGL